jgi:hypothetical protein
MSTNNNSRKELIMDKHLKLLCILFVFSLLALPLTGCEEREAGRSLIVKVDTPKDGTTVTASTVTVSGRLLGTDSYAAKVNINGADVPVANDKYSTNVTLTEGKNVIVIYGRVGQVNLKEKVTVTYVPAKP